MEKLQKHPDYPQLLEAKESLSLRFDENEKIANDKIQHTRQLPVQGDVTNQKILVLAGLQGRNQALKGKVDDYFTITVKRLSQTHRSLAFVRDGKFQSDISSFKAQFELIKLRLEAGVESRPDFLDVFECRGKWYVAPADSIEPLKVFEQKKDAEQFATDLKRRIRLLALIA